MNDMIAALDSTMVEEHQLARTLRAKYPKTSASQNGMNTCRLMVSMNKASAKRYTNTISVTFFLFSFFSFFLTTS